MRKYNFKVILEAVKKGYIVTCPSLPNCYSQGDSEEEALANIKEAIELCLEDMKAHKERIPNPDKIIIGNVSVKI